MKRPSYDDIDDNDGSAWPEYADYLEAKLAAAESLLHSAGQELPEEPQRYASMPTRGGLFPDSVGGWYKKDDYDTLRTAAISLHARVAQLEGGAALYQWLCNNFHSKMERDSNCGVLYIRHAPIDDLCGGWRAVESADEVRTVIAAEAKLAGPSGKEKT